MTEQTSPPPPSGESPFPYPDDPYLKGYTREELQYPPQLTDGEAVAVVRTVGDMAAAEAAKGNSWHEIFSGITYDRKFVSAVLVPPAEDRLPLIVTVYSAAVDELAAGNQPQPMDPPLMVDTIRGTGELHVLLTRDEVLYLPGVHGGGASYWATHHVIR